tara:strand:- start:47684 stop:48661 length:978 start_codon:yes stop_codon:yes gene_type:complete
MSRFAVIDLSQLPPPTVVEVIDFEALLVEVVADYQARNPEFSAATLESDPVVKALEVAAYREMVLRQRVNDAARQRMLPFATGSNLDHMAADIGVQRLVIDPGDPDAVPPVAATYESDANLRLRTQLAPEALTTAGPEGAYIFNGLTAGETPTVIDVDAPTPGVVTLTYTFDPGGISVGIKNVSVQSPVAGSILITVLGWEGDGTVGTVILDQVSAHLSSKYVRPLGDDVTVQGATIKNYAPVATLTIYAGPDASVVETAAEASMQTVAAARHVLGESVTADVLDAALHVPGVRKVTLNGWVDVICNDSEAPYMTGLTLTTEVAS